ncbi:hypothetical protein DFJ77DRAFT_448688 [Powellomyces hirtus]|nr:hypothetical protein DFJ77DRAFT_448688 [Powellomyces hirtus]
MASIKSSTQAVEQAHKSADYHGTKPSETEPTPAASSNGGEGGLGQAQDEAYDEETGEINWDCPCLENMTKEPCGEKFKAAFSCFVYSKEEPKGVDCIEQFREMQKCFRDHPDIYAAELDDDDDEDDEDDDHEEDKKEDNKEDKKEEKKESSSKP